MKQRMNWESHTTGRQKRVASRYWELFLTGWIFEGEIANYLPQAFAQASFPGTLRVDSTPAVIMTGQCFDRTPVDVVGVRKFIDY